MAKLFVGNLPHASSEWEIREWVESHGFRVEAAEIIYDRVTGRSRGFGFVSLGDEVDVQAAITTLNGKRMEGRTLTVNRATPLTGRPENVPAEGKSRHL
jgi:cold-inducible RNA-binding protein